MGTKIRPLTRADRRRLSNMIAKAAAKMGTTQLLTMIRSTGGTSDGDGSGGDFTAVGVEILKVLIDVVETDMAAWFADLLNVDYETFDSMPFDIEVRVLQQLAEAPEVSSFFSGASQLYNKIRTFREQSQTARAQ